MNNRTTHRSIVERWVITGVLELETPAHFGNGDGDALTDMPLLLDEVDGRPLLPGASIAGALRSYLREFESDYGNKEISNSMAALLFGSSRTDEDGRQSPLIVDDAVGNSAGFELRDGVAIDPETRTAADDKKFDMQLLAAGSTFPLRFELTVAKESQKLREALAIALHGLEDGQITLGARKRRGFGQCKVKDWRVWKFDLSNKDGLLDWLGSEQGFRTPKAVEGKDLLAKLGATLSTVDKRTAAHLSATFSIDGTLMIRSGFGESDSGPDMVHIHSKRPGKKPAPIIPGTSFAGVLRQRALKIARTVSGDNQPASKSFVDAMFGPSEIKRGEKHAKASRVSIKETEIEKSTSLVVTRVKIDRFTGGAFESALFSEQPAIGKPETRVTLDLSLRSPKSAELGLLLLLLKDLWTGDLPIGGESSIGRGRLKGIGAELETPQGTWSFKANGEQVDITPNANQLEEWVQAFNQGLEKAQVNHA